MSTTPVRRAVVHGSVLDVLRNETGNATMCGVRHPNRNWRKRLTVDIDAQQVRYETGLVVQMSREGKQWAGRVHCGGEAIGSTRLTEMVENAVAVFERQWTWNQINATPPA